MAKNTYNRTLEEFKLGIDADKGSSLNPYNRTLEEFKCISLCNSYSIAGSYNRTLEEFKYRYIISHSEHVSIL